MSIEIKDFENLSLLEFYDCLKLRINVFVVEQDCAYPEIDAIDKTAHHLLAYNNENILLGYLRIYPSNSKENCLKIGRVTIAQKYRGLGYAGKITAKALDFIKEQKTITEVQISAQSYLKKFYASFGFVQTSKAYLDFGIEHIDMKLKLI